MAVLGALAGVLGLGIVSATGEVGPGTVDVRARWGLGGETELGLPPLGRVSAHTHRTPLIVRARVAELDLEELQRVLAEEDPDRALRDEVAGDLGPLLRRFALRALLLGAVAGGVAGALVPGRRWPHVAVGAGAGLCAVVVLLGLTWRDFEPEAFDEPRFQGPLERAPAVVAAVRRQVEDLEEVAGRVRTLGGQLSRLYAVSSSAAGAGGPVGDEVRILHVSDLHLNPLGVEVVQDLAERFDVDAVLDTGDLTTFGLPLESRIAELVDDVRVPYYYVPGNHDSNANRASFAADPALTLVDGEVVEIGGVRVLGVADPTFTADNETSTEEARSLKEADAFRVAELVDRTRPDVLAVHDPVQAGESFGEVPVVVAGHVHERRRDEREGSLLLTVGSTGATGLGSFTVEADLAYEAQVLHFRDARLVTVDYVSLQGLSGSFVLDRSVVAPDQDEPAEDSEGQSRGTSGPIRRRTSAATSPGSAWRPSAAFEKTVSSSRTTSKRPPVEGTSSIPSITGAQPASSSSARPTARGT